MPGADPVRFGLCSEREKIPHEMEKRGIGVDDNYGEITLLRCTRCGRCWLHYFVEYEYLTASGRWFEGEVPPDIEASLTPKEAVEAFGRMDWYFRSGSAFGGKLLRTTGPLSPWLTPFGG